MKKVSIFGLGNIGVRVAYLLARSRDVAEIRLVDVERRRSQATYLDFVRSNVALSSKLGFASPVEAKEILESDVVVIAASVPSTGTPTLHVPDANTLKMMDGMIENISHFAPQATVAVVSQPAELLCKLVVEDGRIPPENVIGFPLLTNREWLRDELSRRVGIEPADIRMSTVRTLEGEELVPEHTRVGGVPLSVFLSDPAQIRRVVVTEKVANRLQHYHYSPAAVVAEVTMELVNRRRVVATAVVFHAESQIFLEAKAVIGPEGLERILPLTLSEGQQQRYAEYTEAVQHMTRELEKARAG